jgi:hypothetical protein
VSVNDDARMKPHRGYLALAIATLAAAWCAGCTPTGQATLIPTSLQLTMQVATVTPSSLLPTMPAATFRPTPRPLGPTNPLSGLPVADSSLLEVPVVLVSISHFPATGRPQSGLSFAPFVYEFYITEGATRFLAAFYGEWPAAEIPVFGGCETRTEPFTMSAILLGNRVWFDTNADGLQDPDERGIAGLCVNLYDELNQLVAQTTTDSNGFYGFNVAPAEYSVEFMRPDHLRFVAIHAGESLRDSDAEPITGRADVSVSTDDLSIDAGMTALGSPKWPQDEDFDRAPGQVGPIRSGRLIYRHLARSFQDSCLIFAYASPEVLGRLPKCAYVAHQIAGGGAMLDLTELWAIAQANQERAGAELDYSGYTFTDSPPSGGVPATALLVYFAYQNQSGWYYDPASQSYLRYVDTSARREAGILHPEVDRLTRRQLHFENVIVMFAKHQVISPTNLDIHLDAGRTGRAILFRDGVAFDISWSNTRDAQGEPGRPIRFLQTNGEAAPLKRGHTWVIVVTPETTVENISGATWNLAFMQPPGAQ